MSDRSKIEWCDATWNVISGCTPVSAGCAHCYAKTLHDRRHKAYLAGAKLPQQYDKPFKEIQLHPERLEMPLHWKRPRRIFVNSTSDLFHEDVPFDFIDRVMATMVYIWRHTYMILTKRPERMVDYFRHYTTNRRKIVPSNIWLGVSVEDQKAADERIPQLLRTPAALRFVSCEPLLVPVDLWGARYANPNGGKTGAVTSWLGGLDWVICGGESGPGARPMHPDWARSLRDQCQAAGVPFFFKQMGEWETWEKLPSDIDDYRIPVQKWEDGSCSVRVGKKSAGRLLDGVEWNEFPGGRG